MTASQTMIARAVGLRRELRGQGLVLAGLFVLGLGLACSGLIEAAVERVEVRP
jgi:hypothetical protein